MWGPEFRAPRSASAAGESAGSGAPGTPRQPSPCLLRAKAAERCDEGGSRRGRCSGPPATGPEPKEGPALPWALVGGLGGGLTLGGPTDSPAPAGTQWLCSACGPLGPENSSSPPLPGPRRDSELAGWVQVVRELAPHHSLSWAHAGWPAGSVGDFGVKRLLRKGCRPAVGGRLRTGLAGTAPTNLLEPWTPLSGGRWQEEGPGRDPAEATASPECPHHSRATPSTCLPLAPWVMPCGQQGSLGPEGPDAPVSWSGALCPAPAPCAPGRAGRAASGLPGESSRTPAPTPAWSPLCVLSTCRLRALRAPLPWVAPPHRPRPTCPAPLSPVWAFSLM